MRVWTWIVVVVIAMIAAERRADACSHPFGLGTVRLVAPAADAADVPTDAVVVVHATDCCVDEGGELPRPFEELLRLEDASDVEVAVEITAGDYWNESYLTTRTVTLRPLAPLAADTTYRIVAGLDVLGTFTTGAGPSPELPVPTPEVTVDLGTPTRCDEAGELACCSPTELTRVHLAGLSPDLLYTITRVDDDSLIADQVAADAVGYQYCFSPRDIEPAPGLATTPWIVGDQGQIEVAIVAHDAAGRTSAPAQTTFLFDCGDQAVSEDPDACGCRGGTGGGAAVVLVALALLAVSRRSSGRPCRRPMP